VRRGAGHEVGEVVEHARPGRFYIRLSTSTQGCSSPNTNATFGPLHPGRGGRRCLRRTHCSMSKTSTSTTAGDGARRRSSGPPASRSAPARSLASSARAARKVHHRSCGPWTGRSSSRPHPGQWARRHHVLRFQWRDFRRRGVVQYVFQDPLRSLDGDLLIFDSIAEPLRIRGVRPAPLSRRPCARTPKRSI